MSSPIKIIGTLPTHPITGAAPQTILQTNYNNAATAAALAGKGSTWASDLAQGKTFLSGDDPAYEWTQALSPTEDYEVDLIGLSGRVVTPDLSGADNPFLHPFCANPQWDFEFFIAPDAPYQYLAAPPPTSASGISSHSDYTAAVQAAAKDFGINVPDVVGMETDCNLVPIPYRPLHGDRKSVV